MKSLLVVLLLSLSTSVWAADKVLFVLTSHNKMGELDKKTGFWLSELTHPYYVITDAGYEVEIASIEGGMAPIDPASLDTSDKANQRFLQDAKLMAMVINSKALQSVKANDYRAVVYAGGHGTMWDFSNNPLVNTLTADIYQNNGLIAAICHGPSALTDVKLTTGEYLVSGKQVAAFTNEEEAQVELTEVVPFLLQDKLIERGAKHVYAKPWQSNAVIDQRLITGQNPQSAHRVGELLVEALAK